MSHLTLNTDKRRHGVKYAFKFLMLNGPNTKCMNFGAFNLSFYYSWFKFHKKSEFGEVDEDHWNVTKTETTWNREGV